MGPIKYVCHSSAWFFIPLIFTITPPTMSSLLCLCVCVCETNSSSQNLRTQNFHKSCRLSVENRLSFLLGVGARVHTCFSTFHAHKLPYIYIYLYKSGGAG